MWRVQPGVLISVMLVQQVLARPPSLRRVAQLAGIASPNDNIRFAIAVTVRIRAVQGHLVARLICDGVVATIYAHPEIPKDPPLQTLHSGLHGSLEKSFRNALNRLAMRLEAEISGMCLQVIPQLPQFGEPA